MNAVIYARFSSHSQTEQSIEGQLKVCHEYAKKNDYGIVGEYIDRAISGTTDNRPQFQQMLHDSSKKQFEVVLVYQLDRFARSREDSAVNKLRLKKNGVKVVSANENISNDPSGILMEAVLEGMAEYYSAELSQKVRRGMTINSQKCLNNGGHPPFGYKIVDKRFCIDETKAAFVLKAFQMYADGCTMKAIIEYMNTYQLKTSAGKPFGRTTLYPIFSCKKYIGVYSSCGIETVGGIPRIVPDKLFYEVQEIMEKNKRAPARAKAKEEYLLTTKLFCGRCKEPMVGYSGTSKTGAVHLYYICMGRKRKICDKEYVKKAYIENRVIHDCRATLTDEKIAEVVSGLMKMQAKEKDRSNLKHLQKQLADNERRTSNLLSAVTECDSERGRKALYTQLPALDEERNSLVEQIAKEEIFLPNVEEKDYIYFLKHLRDGDVNDLNYRRLLISVLVNKIYLYDDKYTVYFNTDRIPSEITIDMIEAIEAADSSYLVGSGRPRTDLFPARGIIGLFFYSQHAIIEITIV